LLRGERTQASSPKEQRQRGDRNVARRIVFAWVTVPGYRAFLEIGRHVGSANPAVTTVYRYRRARGENFARLLAPLPALLAPLPACSPLCGAAYPLCRVGSK